MVVTPSVTELRALRRSFNADCDTALKGFKAPRSPAGPSPAKLFEDAKLSYEKARNAYQQSIDVLEPDDDGDKIEDLKFTLESLDAKFDTVLSSYEDIQAADETVTGGVVAPTDLEKVLLEESRLLDLEEEYQLKLSKQKRKIELQRKLAEAKSISVPSAGASSVSSLNPRQFIQQRVQSTPRPSLYVPAVPSTDNTVSSAPSAVINPAASVTPPPAPTTTGNAGAAGLSRTDTAAADTSKLVTELLNTTNALSYMNMKRIEGIGRTFNGDYSQWRSFKREMERDLKRINSWDEALDILERRCKGKPLSTMRANRDRYGDCERAYTETMDIFEKLYGNPRLILRDLYDKLTKGERAKWNSGSLHDLHSDLYDGLLPDDDDPEWKIKLNGRETVELIIKKRLPDQSRKRLAGKLHSEGKVSMSYKDLLEFILDEINRTTHFLYEDFVDEDKPSTSRGHNKRNSGNSGRKHNSGQLNKITSDEAAVSAQSAPDSGKKFPCPACHKFDCTALDKCSKFLEMNRHSRWHLVKTKGRCLCCLSFGHISKLCAAKKICNNCDGSRHHHMLLCPGRAQTDNSANVNHIAENDSDIECSSLSMSNGRRQRYIPVTHAILRSKTSGKMQEVLLMIDTGADMCLLQMVVAKGLGADGKKERISVITANGTSTYDALVCDFEIRGLHGDTFHELNGVRCMDGINITHTNPLMQVWDYDEHPHLNGLNLPFLKSNVVQLVIGTCHPLLQNLTDPVCPIDGNGPVAKKSVFGYMVVGSEDNCSTQHCHVNKMHVINSVNFVEDAVCSGDANTCDLLHKQINHHFYSDYAGDDDDDTCPSTDDAKALCILEDSLNEVDGKWELSLPLRSADIQLPNNSSYALKRLRSLVRQLNRRSDLKEFYCSKMQELTETHLEKVGKFSLHDVAGLIWYVCHFVTKQAKARIVYDGPAEYQGVSLNMILFDGPDIVQKLWDVLVRFREGAVAFTFDLKNMFMSVGISPEHRDLLRIVWFADPTDINSELCVYRFVDLPYGLNCSSCIATFALRKTAQTNPTKACIQAVDMTSQSYYVDDCLESVSSSDEAIKVVLDHFKMIESRNFKAHKFVSNDRDVLRSIPDEYLADNMKGIDLDFDGLPQQRVLGISWNPETDELVVNVNIVQMPYTKRGLWSMISQIYDPLGFCCPFMLPGRRILQDLCRTVKDWDEEIPDDIRKKWDKWASGLKQLEKIRIQRCYTKLKDVKSFELHSFCDASTTGKGCVTYLRSMNDEAVYVAFVSAKSLVIPSDTNTTVPKLELLAADLCARQHAKARDALRLSISQEYFWSDSTVVISWLKDTRKRHSKFVSRRLDNIKRKSEVSSWRHVPTDMNPSDLASRGIMPAKADPDHMWFKGPDFLWSSKSDDWPTATNSDVASLSNDNAVDDILNYCCINHLVEESDACLFSSVDHAVAIKNKAESGRLMKPVPPIYRDILHQHSRSYPMARTIALRTRYVTNKCLAPAGLAIEVQGSISCSELDSAVIDLVRVAQEDCYTFRVLCQIKELGFSAVLQKQPKGSVLQSLNVIKSLMPFVDENFVLRVGGRMQNTSYPFDNIHQMILPKRHHLTQVLVMQVHQDSGHLGHNYVLAELMKKFWVVHGGCSVKFYLEKCLYCQEKRLKPQVQLMSPLPVCRSEQPKYAFSHTGVDLWGPMTVQVSRRSHGKRWGVMLTCLATRAVHLEIVEDLSTSGFIQSLLRFLNRRGQCTEHLYSDCGSNFQGCVSEFESIVALLDAKLMKDFGITKTLKFDDELSDRFEQLDKAKVEAALSRRHVDISWSFNTPTASSAGGSWERLIRDTKKILTALLIKGMEGVPALNRRTPTDFELITIITEVEAIMNNRPMTRISDKPDDFQALTPQMILTGVVDPSVPVHDFSKPDEYRKSWRFSQVVTEQFWSRWLTLYLPWLQVRSKWLEQSPNVKVGDLVLCIDMKTAGRLDYPKAIVTKVFPDKHNTVRNVAIKFANGKEYERPIQKIVKLEIDAETMSCSKSIDHNVINNFAANMMLVNMY